MRSSAFRRRKIAVVCALLAMVSLRGFAPGVAAPIDGDEFEFSGGGGTYQYVPACSSTQYRAGYLEGQARFRHLAEGGGSIAASAAFMSSEITSADTGRFMRYSVVGSLRFGMHGRYVGFEAGPAFGSFFLSEDQVQFLPAARLWVGRIDVVQVWASVLADETASVNRIAGVGATFLNDSFRLSAGLTGSAGDSATGILDLAIPSSNRALWTIVAGQVGDRTNSITLGFRLTPGGAARVYESWFRQ